MPDTGAQPRWVFRSNVAQLIAVVDRVAPQRMRQAVEIVRGEAMRSMQGAKTGRYYYVPGTRTRYRASAAGEAPAVATGRGIGSVNAEVRDARVGGHSQTIGVVGSTLDHMAKLEEGTPRIRPRPWLRPAFRKTKDRVIQSIGGTRWV